MRAIPSLRPRETEGPSPHAPVPLIGKPETSVRRVPDSQFLAVHLTPHLWGYFDLAEAISLRAQLDAEISAMTEGFA